MTWSFLAGAVFSVVVGIVLIAEAVLFGMYRVPIAPDVFVLGVAWFVLAVIGLIVHASAETYHAND